MRPTAPQPRIAASILPADFSRLGDECVALEQAGVDRIQWEKSLVVKKATWSRLAVCAGDSPSTLGMFGNDQNREPLAIPQLSLLYHMLDATAGGRAST